MVVSLCFCYSVENDDQIFRNELVLTQNGLHANPKSYGVWNHRQFIMKTIKKPDWPEELRLCNLFLKFDSRNCKFLNIPLTKKESIIV